MLCVSTSAEDVMHYLCARSAADIRLAKPLI